MHACGHDMHVTWLMGAATLLADTRDAWKGTLMLVFQPAEETGRGAQAMVDAGLLTRFPKPDVILGQHVMVGPAGSIGSRAGVITSAADSLQIRMFGRGAHGSMPQASVDPVVMAAATVLRLQTIVSRELAASEAAVVTVGALQAGEKENVIPDEAVIKLNVRTFDAMSGLASSQRSRESSTPRPPRPVLRSRRKSHLSIATRSVTNDPDATGRVVDAFRKHFGGDRVREAKPTSASEDFGVFGAAWQTPSVFWFIGGTDPKKYAEAKQAGRVREIPTNHNPGFAPVLQPTLETGVAAMVVAAQAWVAAPSLCDRFTSRSLGTVSMIETMAATTMSRLNANAISAA